MGSKSAGSSQQRISRFAAATVSIAGGGAAPARGVPGNVAGSGSVAAAATVSIAGGGAAPARGVPGKVAGSGSVAAAATVSIAGGGAVPACRGVAGVMSETTS